MRILNLYAGIGGNRRLWGNLHNITAVESDPQIAAVYKALYPQDTVLIEDAHEYLLNHYKEFDFIWSSPPCQTHSSMRHNLAVRFRGTKAEYPDMKLYQEILLLQYECKALWAVENVKPYYKPLILPTASLQRHYIWSNFNITDRSFLTDKLRTAQIPDLSKLHGVDLTRFKLPNKRQILRNCVNAELGKHVLECAGQL